MPTSIKTDYPKVWISNGRYYYVHKRRWIPLTRIEDGESAMLAALARAKRPSSETVADMLSAYLGKGIPRVRLVIPIPALAG